MEKKNYMTSNTEEMVSIPRAEYEALLKKQDSLEKQLEDACKRYDWLVQQLALSKKKLFGKSSELADESVMEQLSLLFNEAEVTDSGSFTARDEKTEVRSYTRSRRSGSIEDVIPEGIPVETVEHRLEGEDLLCPKCGEEMEVIGKESRKTMKIIPASIVVREDVYFTYACKKCEEESGEAVIRKAERLPAFLPGSFASPEAVAYLMTQKYVMYSPIYRMEQELNRMGVNLSRQTMSNWILHASEDWLKPVYEALKKKLRAQRVLHADETTLQVLHEPGKSAESKSYIWLYRTSGDAENAIVLYDYKPNRKPENAEKFLEGFTGWLHADGYAGYRKLPEKIRIVGCWAHARRKFDEALNTLPESGRKGSPAARGEAYISELFQIEGRLSGLSPEERRKQRLEEEKPILDALLAWAEGLRPKTAAKSALGKALYYLEEQKPYLLRYLEDGRLELSNNRAERSIKPFVMGRKNWLFANTPAGACSSAVISSIVETAKENGLDPYKYLLYIFKTAPALERQKQDWTDPLLPENAPKDCKTKNNPKDA